MLSFWETILSEWERKTLPQIFPRTKEIPVSGFGQLNKILVINGFRRTGKTYLLLSAIAKLLKTYSKKDIFYLNFEDERIPLTTHVLTDLLPAFQAHFGQKPKFLFLDEVQNIPLWSKIYSPDFGQRRYADFFDRFLFQNEQFELPSELRGRSLEQK